MTTMKAPWRDFYRRDLASAVEVTATTGHLTAARTPPVGVTSGEPTASANVLVSSSSGARNKPEQR